MLHFVFVVQQIIFLSVLLKKKEILTSSNLFLQKQFQLKYLKCLNSKVVAEA